MRVATGYNPRWVKDFCRLIDGTLIDFFKAHLAEIVNERFQKPALSALFDIGLQLGGFVVLAVPGRRFSCIPAVLGIVIQHLSRVLSGPHRPTNHLTLLVAQNIGTFRRVIKATRDQFCIN